MTFPRAAIIFIVKAAVRGCVIIGQPLDLDPYLNYDKCSMLLIQNIRSYLTKVYLGKRNGEGSV